MRKAGVPVTNVVQLTCDGCGSGYQMAMAHVKAKQRLGMTRWFCSRACWKASLNQTRQGPVNPNWKGGRSIRPDGYVEVRVNGRRKLEHVHLMEQHLGRRMNRGEVVHHKNADRTDNRLENLEVMTVSEHMRLHHKNGVSHRRRVKRCRICAETFTADRSNQTICPRPECRKERSRQYCLTYHNKHRAALVSLQCRICGTTFRGRPRSNAKGRTCSPRCYRLYQLAYSLARRARGVTSQ